jgi:prophage regulatory protein
MSQILEFNDATTLPGSSEKELRLIGLVVVLALTSLGKTTLYKLIGLGEFPRPVQLTEDGRRVAWLLHEVQSWIRARAVERDAVSVKQGGENV